MRFASILICCFSFFLGACGPSGFEKNYIPELDYGASGQGSLEKCISPRVVRVPASETLNSLKERATRDGYVLIGQAQWKSTYAESEDEALKQGKKVGACFVYWQRVDAGFIKTTRMETEHIPARETTIIQNGIEQTVILEPSRTEYTEVPVTLKQYDYLALFFLKKRENSTQTP